MVEVSKDNPKSESLNETDLEYISDAILGIAFSIVAMVAAQR